MSRRPIEFAKHPYPFPSPHEVRGVVRHVVDGDTLDVLVDLGFNQYTYVVVRVLGVDTPEIVGATRQAGLEAKAFTEQLVLGKPVVLFVQPDRQTFGRWLAEVFYWAGGTSTSLANALKAAGHA